jgi:Nucleoside-diphosphate-sugar pyrophosphorylase involved in lipopolysaccharide biosynthesis/translation initiation factor 2B, gamma/epsilon subunits (eIF-2Bgamma/eIF-2Bepsilon)
MDKYINSTLSETALIFRECDIVDSVIRNKSIIGDRSIIYKSNISDIVEINRDCRIRYSNIGFGTTINKN